MEHDWAPIAPPEDNGIMCNVCLQCKCCSDCTDECPGEWVPDDEIHDPENCWVCKFKATPIEELRSRIRNMR